MGDRQSNITNAIQKIKESDIVVHDISPIYETEPYGVEEQPKFLNAAIKISTKFEPQELLEKLLHIEKELGRERKERWGPRTLDLDILFYDNIILNEENLIIPHTDMINRNFVLKPLCDIAPKAVHPVCSKTVLELYKELNK
jgi:2-amino-4-hydroxy-6-hydroxymethyldihydropteridine diphosphokinase